MRQIRLGAIAIAAAVLLIAAAAGFSDPPSIVGRLNYTAGSVSFLPGSLDEWAPAILNYPLSAGDHLWTDTGGRAEIHVGSAAFRLDQGTEMSFLTLDDQTVQLRLSQGSLNVRLRQVAPGETWEIDTPNSVITLTRAGSYRIDATPDGEVDITARSGLAEVAAGVDVFDIGPMSSAHISGFESVVYWTQPAAGQDSWDAWCAARDAREDKLTAIRYVPREMIGIEDLDGNGVWITVAVYGTVWYPTRVPAGWAPYRYGRWAWVAPWGWTWIDDAPWGFAPFHYGRWAYVQSRWVWIPGTLSVRPVYAPALVVFIGGTSPDSLGWFPLGPREIYIPAYLATPVYVQRLNAPSIANLTPLMIQRYDVVRAPYVNRTVPTAITIAPRQAFVQSRPISEVPYASIRVDPQRLPVTGMGPQLAPQRESVLVVPPGQQRPVASPPQAALNRPVYTRTPPAAAPQPFTPGQQTTGGGTTSTAQPVQSPANQPVARPGIIVLNPTNRIQSPPNAQPATTQPTTQQPTTQQPATTRPTTQQPTTQQPATTRPTTQQPTTQQPGASGKQTDAQARLDKLDKESLRDLQKHLESTRNIKGIKLDYNALQKQINDLRKALNDAQKDLKAGKVDAALKAAEQIQDQIDDMEKLISDAEQAASRGTGSSQGGQGSQQGGQGQQGGGGKPNR
jgi:molecular chaperone GrpE (heat shock protein)